MDFRFEAARTRQFAPRGAGVSHLPECFTWIWSKFSLDEPEFVIYSSKNIAQAVAAEILFQTLIMINSRICRICDDDGVFLYLVGCILEAMVTVVEWSDDYNTGIPDIDKEHRGIFLLINDLYGKVEAGSGEASLKSTIEALTDYVDYHFDREEILMKASGYEDMESHIAGHRKLQSQLEAYKQSYERNPQGFDMADFMAFLTYWLKNHILQSDMAYVPRVQRHVKQRAKQ